jgi:hypothetical protein
MRENAIPCIVAHEAFIQMYAIMHTRRMHMSEVQFACKRMQMYARSCMESAYFCTHS